MIVPEKLPGIIQYLELLFTPHSVTVGVRNFYIIHNNIIYVEIVFILTSFFFKGLLYKTVLLRSTHNNPTVKGTFNPEILPKFIFNTTLPACMDLVHTHTTVIRAAAENERKRRVSPLKLIVIDKVFFSLRNDCTNFFFFYSSRRFF